MASKPLDGFFEIFRQRAKPAQSQGVPGTAIHGGFIEFKEKSAELTSRESRNRTFKDSLVNTSIVAAGVRAYLNHISSAGWTFSPSEDDMDGMYADLLEAILTDDPMISWRRIVRRASMYRYWGFGVQEWTIRRRDDGVITYANIAPRPQSTIERWDVNTDGSLNGVVQESPQTGEELYLPRSKLMYIVDDSVDDSPEGLGIFRQLVEPVKRLKRYEQLEGFGFETDLRGIPIGYAPFTELNAMVTSGEITDEQRGRIEKPITDFIKKHIKTPETGLLLDSKVYESQDDSGRPSAAKQWEIDLLSGDSHSFEQNAEAIERLNREMARIMGVEQLLLGATSTGSFALSEDKTHAFYLMLDGALQDVKEAVGRDLVDNIWRLNGWPVETMPEVVPEAVRFNDVEQIAAVLSDMATAGAVLSPDDPAINALRELAGLPLQDEDITNRMLEEERINAEFERGRMTGGGDGGGMGGM